MRLIYTFLIVTQLATIVQSRMGIITSLESTGLLEQIEIMHSKFVIRFNKTKAKIEVRSKDMSHDSVLSRKVL